MRELQGSQPMGGMQTGMQQQQGGGMPPGAMQFAQQFMGGGAGAGGGAAGGSAAGAGGAAGGGGGSSMLASAGPWAALAAVVAANEYGAKDAGRRSDSKGHHLQQALTGEGMSKDMDYYGDKVGGPGGKALSLLGKTGSPKDLLKLMGKSKTWKPWEWF